MPIPSLAFSKTGLLRRSAFVLAALAAFATPGRSGPMEDVSGFFAEKFSRINAAVRSGPWDIYATGYAWHAPWAYDAATRARLNDTTWGGGFGRSVTDGDGDRHSVFFVTFSDSHRTPQFVLSYAWQRYWPANRELSLGWGYMAFLFSREDVARHVPLPAVLPCASIRYRRWEAIGQFVPHVSKDIKGDVFFIFMRVGL